MFIRLGNGGIAPYKKEKLDDNEDDGTMPESLATLEEAVVGHRIKSAESIDGVMVITLDNGKTVEMRGTADCCAYTELETFLLHVDRIDHIITGVGTTNGYETWHIFADFGDVMEMRVGWSAGNPFYYGYGFDIQVK